MPGEPVGTQSVPMTEIQDLQRQGSVPNPKSEEAESQPKRTAAEAKAINAKLLEELQHLEAKLLPGVPDLTPKDTLLDLSDLQAKHPELHFTWTNIRHPNKADLKRARGYIRLPADEGGREIGGELAIFVTTKRLHEARLERFKKLHEARLKAHVGEMQDAAYKVAEEMRKQFGVTVDVSRLFVNEGG